jgi:hypothetical protein
VVDEPVVVLSLVALPPLEPPLLTITSTATAHATSASGAKRRAGERNMAGS